MFETHEGIFTSFSDNRNISNEKFQKRIPYFTLQRTKHIQIIFRGWFEELFNAASIVG